MAVFTPVSDAEIRDFIVQFSLGTLKQAEGVSAGVENTNYFVDIASERYVLTLFENILYGELPFFISLNLHLLAQGFPCAEPIADKQGVCLHRLKAKPTVLWQCLHGESVMSPSDIHCEAMGDVLARLHLATQSFSEQRQDPRGPDWWLKAQSQLKDRLEVDEERILSQEIVFHSVADWDSLPAGIIHTDCFRDNVLFADGEISGVIDFFNASYGPYLYDLAICVNDWCTEDSCLDLSKTRLLLAAYQKVRPLSEGEKKLWPKMLRAAALRFWLSRLLDERFPKQASFVTVKDPKEFQRLLVYHRDNPCLFEQVY